METIRLFTTYQVFRQIPGRHRQTPRSKDTEVSMMTCHFDVVHWMLGAAASRRAVITDLSRSVTSGLYCISDGIHPRLPAVSLKGATRTQSVRQRQRRVVVNSIFNKLSTR